MTQGSIVARDAARGYVLLLDPDEIALLHLVRPGRRPPLAGSPDWQAVARLARVHRLEPRLHRATARREGG